MSGQVGGNLGDTRFARYFLGRLRREQTVAAYDNAIAKRVLIAEDMVVEAREITAFYMGPAGAGRSDTDLEKFLRQGGKQRQVGDAELAIQDGEFVYADSNRPKSRRIGAGERTVGQPDCGKLEERDLRRNLLRLIRRLAAPLRSQDVVTLLVLAQAIETSKISVGQVLAALRLHHPIISIFCPIAGFEQSLLDLLCRGLVMPGKVTELNGYEAYARIRMMQRRSIEARWLLACFAGSQFDAEHLQKNISNVAQFNCPILCIAESDDLLPSKLVSAAHLKLSCGPLDPEILHATISTVLGEVGAEALDEIDCSYLDLADVALAVRPGNSPARAIELLAKMALENQKSQQGAAGTGETARPFRQQKVGRNSSSKGLEAYRNTGSQVVQPEKANDVGNDSIVPFIENLTGYGEAVEWASNLKIDLEEWRAGKLGWNEMTSKILLFGPPGTGKTMFARALCNSLQIPLVSTSVATWLEPSYLGDVVRRMRRSFDEAAAHKPSILFIDEFDGIGLRGTKGHHSDYWNTVVNKALELLDGTIAATGIIIVGATNRPDAIDPALLRAGRIEHKVDIGLPDTAALMGIFRHHLGKDLDAIAASMPPAGESRPS